MRDGERVSDAIKDMTETLEDRNEILGNIALAVESLAAQESVKDSLHNTGGATDEEVSEAVDADGSSDVRDTAQSDSGVAETDTDNIVKRWLGMHGYSYEKFEWGHIGGRTVYISLDGYIDDFESFQDSLRGLDSREWIPDDERNEMDIEELRYHVRKEAGEA
ncbi:hypothetical protein BRC81_00155 [Halobacteriales archaeon QS_1_68_20]|nr:MAG: hypothetical protein BRC81_00155 [Halobacteriales archaeon QS_1_68_20]